MTKRFSLLIILLISFVGVFFSGFLSYQEIFSQGCSNQIVSCSTNTGSTATIPACVYGLVMYIAILLVAFWGYLAKE